MTLQEEQDKITNRIMSIYSQLNGIDPNTDHAVNLSGELESLQEQYNCLELEKTREANNEFDLKEMATYYGGWDKLREVIDRLENETK